MNKTMYRIVSGLFTIYFKLILRWKVIGKEYGPDNGSLVIMANHVSFFDPPVVGSILSRPVHFMAKEELFRIPVLSWVIKNVGAFPVKRGRPDRAALKKSYKILKSNEVLGIFPEGTRHKPGNLGKARSGAVIIPIKMKTPILPVGIKYKGLKLYVSIGKPFTLEDFYDKNLSREEIRTAGEIIMNKIKSELCSI